MTPVEHATQLSAAQLAALRAIDSPTVANAIEEFNVRDRRRGYMDERVRCLFPELGVLVGYAFPITFKDRAPSDPPMRPRWLDALAALTKLPEPRIIVAHYASPEVPAALVGEIMCTAVKRLGGVAVITDGPVRDLAEVRALGIHYFAPGAVVSHGQLTVQSFGIPVTVGGLLVRPGDLLHADQNGVVHIPGEIAASVADKAAAVRAREAGYLEILAAPDFTLEKFRRALLG